MSNEEIEEVVRKVNGRFRGIQHVGPPELIGDNDLVLFEHDCLPHKVVTCVRISECTEMNLLLHLAEARARWMPKAVAAD